MSPAKHLADQLEMLHAVRAVTSRVRPDLAGTLAHVVQVAVQSLSCEVGLLRTGAGQLAVTSTWDPIADDDPRLAAAAQTLLECAANGATCVQDTDVTPLPHPLGHEHGVRSLLALPLPPPVGGVLVVAHTSANPRGFTGLCRDLGRQLADAAGVVLHTASLREESTGSSTSTTPPGTTPATTCCAAAPTCYAATDAPTTCACAWAATSSPSSCPTPGPWPPTACTPSPPNSAG